MKRIIADALGPLRDGYGVGRICAADHALFDGIVQYAAGDLEPCVSGRKADLSGAGERADADLFRACGDRDRVQPNTIKRKIVDPLCPFRDGIVQDVLPGVPYGSVSNVPAARMAASSPESFQGAMWPEPALKKR